MNRLWTVEQLAEYLGVKKSWIYDRTVPSCEDRIPHFKMGKYLRFDIESAEFKEWLLRSVRK
jgi:excisionase family DNA binding protein